MIAYFSYIYCISKHPLKACFCLISFASQSQWRWSAKRFSFTSWALACRSPLCSFGPPGWCLSIAGGRQVDGSSFSGQPSVAFYGAKAQQRGFSPPHQPFFNTFILISKRGRLWCFGTLSFASVVLMESSHCFFPFRWFIFYFSKRTFDSSVIEWLLHAGVWTLLISEPSFIATRVAA